MCQDPVLTPISSYLLTFNLPEWFSGAENWYNLLFQLSVGYIINFMFYITQVYIPNIKRTITVKECISERISNIISDMDKGLSSLARLYSQNYDKTYYTEDDLNAMCKIRFSDKVDIAIASKTTANHFEYFTVRQWLEVCILDVDNDIDRLFKYYANEISVNLMEVTEAILHSQYQDVLLTLLHTPNDVNME